MGCICKVKEKELELKYASVPNRLFYWIAPFVLQAINTLLLHSLAEAIRSARERDRPTRDPCATYRARAVTCFSVHLSYIVRCIEAVTQRHRRIPVSRMLHNISME